MVSREAALNFNPFLIRDKLCTFRNSRVSIGLLLRFYGLVDWDIRRGVVVDDPVGCERNNNASKAL
jgi:hypothetical protein